MSLAPLRLLAVLPLLAAGPPDRLPEKAEVTYEGTYRFTEAPRARPQRAPRRIDLNSAISALSTAAPRGVDYEGAITITAIFDGAAVRATVTGTGGIASNSLSGVVEDGRCRLIDSRRMVVFEGRCDSGGFDGQISGTENYRRVLNGRFSARARDLVDVAAREATAAEKRRTADAAAAEKKGRDDARRAKLKPLCDAGKLSACVEMDTLDQD